MRRLLVSAVSISVILAACGQQGAAPTAVNPNQTQAAAVPAGPPPVPADATAVRGTVAIEGLAQLPKTLQLQLRLLDMSDPSIAPPAVAERLEPAPAYLPYNYALPYDAAQINPEGKYAVEAAIVSGSAILYGTRAGSPVLTQGAGNEASLSLERGGGPPKDIAPADLIKMEYDKLAGSIGGMKMTKGERIDPDATLAWDVFSDSKQVRFVRKMINYDKGRDTQFNYAYRMGKPWVIEREVGGVHSYIGWGDDGAVVLNRVGKDGQFDEAEVAALQAQAAAMLLEASQP